MKYSFPALLFVAVVLGVVAWAILQGIAEALAALPHERPAAAAEKRCKCPAGACKCCGCKGP